MIPMTYTEPVRISRRTSMKTATIIAALTILGTIIIVATTAGQASAALADLATILEVLGGGQR